MPITGSTVAASTALGTTATVTVSSTGASGSGTCDADGTLVVPVSSGLNLYPSVNLYPSINLYPGGLAHESSLSPGSFSGGGVTVVVSVNIAGTVG